MREQKSGRKREMKEDDEEMKTEGGGKESKTSTAPCIPPSPASLRRLSQPSLV